MSESIINLIVSADLVAIDLETTGLERDSEIFSIAFSWRGKSSKISSTAYLLDRFTHPRDLISNNELIVGDLLRATLFNKHFGGTVLFHNHLFDLKFLFLRFHAKVERFSKDQICHILDTMQFSRVLRNNKFQTHTDPAGLKCHALKYLAREYLSDQISDVKSFEEVTGGRNIRECDPQEVLNYNRQDAELTLRLFLKLKSICSADEWAYFELTEGPHLLNLFYLTYHGVPFDKALAHALCDEIIQEQEIVARKIFKAVGREVNLASNVAIAKAIFYNPRVSYIDPNTGTKSIIRPLYITENDQSKVDLDTLSTIKRRIETIDPTSTAPQLMQLLTRHVELQKALSKIESLLKYCIPEPDGTRIYPNISASALSGRVTCTKPNLLGLPKKIFKNGKLPEDAPGDLNRALDKKSVRSLICVGPDKRILSIDINGLDLVIIADGADRELVGSEFYWKEFLRPQHGQIVDSHFALLQKFQPELFSETFKGFKALGLEDPQVYWAKKPSADEAEPKRKYIIFVHKQSGQQKKIYFPEGDTDLEAGLARVREISKRLNLAISYIMGPAAAAVKLTEAKEAQVTASEAKDLVDRFYSFEYGFPEIRLFQDRVANSLYWDGCYHSPFGRVFYANVWSELCRQRNESPTFEFIIFLNSSYFYILAEEWRQEVDPVIENLRMVDRKFGLYFKRIHRVVRLSPYTFREQDTGKPKFKLRKTEESIVESSQFELNRIALTHEVEKEIDRSACWSTEEEIVVQELIRDGLGFIPEKNIIMYRTRSSGPASNYFNHYLPILKAAKKFFPAYCQGVATTVAKKCLTRIRERLDLETKTAVIIFFIHDQIDVVCSVEEVEIVRNILEESVAIDMSPLSMRFSGEFKNNQQEFR